MDFQLTESQERVRALVEEFTATEIAPGAAERDLAGDFAPVYDILMNKMGPLGLLGLSYPREYGGQGKDHIAFVAAMFEICRFDVSVGAAWSVLLSLGSWPIYKFGTEQQKQQYLVPLCKGEKMCAFALTEPNAGSDAGMQETTATLIHNHYVLNGRKIYITNAGFADTYVVMAMTDKSKGTKGISAFIVEKGTQGFEFGREEVTMGIRSTTQREIIMTDCMIPKDHLLGEEGTGFKIAMTAVDVGRLGVAAQAVGVSWGATDVAISHSLNRVQFGKPLSANQGVSFMLANMATKVELAKLMVLKAAWLSSQELPYTKEAAMAKMYASDTAMEVTTDAVQILGGAGYICDNPVERMMRDAKILQIYEGTNQIQRIVIAGKILR